MLARAEPLDEVEPDLDHVSAAGGGGRRVGNHLLHRPPNQRHAQQRHLRLQSLLLLPFKWLARAVDEDADADVGKKRQWLLAREGQVDDGGCWQCNGKPVCEVGWKWGRGGVGRLAWVGGGATGRMGRRVWWEVEFCRKDVLVNAAHQKRETDDKVQLSKM